MESKKKEVGCEKIKVNCKKVRHYDLSLCCPNPKESEACSCTDLWWNYPASNCCRDKSFMESKKKKVGCEKIKVNCKKVRYYDLSLCCPRPKVIEMNEMTHTTKNTPGHHNNLGALGVRSLKKANGGQGTGIAHDSEACSCTDLWWNYPASNCCRDKSFMESKKKEVGCEKIKVNCKKVRHYDLSLCCPNPKESEACSCTDLWWNYPASNCC